MARTARVLLSVPTSSAAHERFFSSAGRLITGSRSSMYAVYAEMVLFLHGSIELIPKNVAVLSDPQAEKAVRSHLSKPRDEVA